MKRFFSSNITVSKFRYFFLENVFFSFLVSFFCSFSCFKALGKHNKQELEYLINLYQQNHKKKMNVKNLKTHLSHILEKRTKTITKVEEKFQNLLPGSLENKAVSTQEQK